MATKSVKMILPYIRGSYVYIDEPRTNDNGSLKYGMQIILDKKEHAELIEQVESTIGKIFEVAFPEVKKHSMLKNPLRDGDTERDEPHMENKVFINASNHRKPGIVNRNNRHATSEEIEEYGFSGCVFVVQVTFYDFKSDSAKGVAVALENVMLKKKGERLDGREDADSAFKEFKEDGEDDDEVFEDI